MYVRFVFFFCDVGSFLYPRMDSFFYSRGRCFMIFRNNLPFFLVVVDYKVIEV